MNGTVALLAVCVLLVAGVALPVAGAVTDGAATEGHAAQAGTTPPGSANESVEPDAPGARLAGVIEVQEAEVEGELAGRAFGIRLARANSNASKAAVVADQVVELTRQMDVLREQKRALIEARRNGTITRARFRAEVAALAARTGAVEHRLERTAAVSNDLPADLLAEKGVNASAIQTLRTDARDLSGPEVAEIARSIAGPNVGRGLVGNASRGRPTDLPGTERTPTDTDDLPLPTIPTDTISDIVDGQDDDGGNESDTPDGGLLDGQGDGILGDQGDGEGNESETDDGEGIDVPVV